MKDLREMTSKELKEMAKGLKISNWWNLKKAVLIAKIEEVQNMSTEEKQARADQKAKEDAALAEYQKNWRKYTARFNPIEFMEKFRSGEIVLNAENQPEQSESTEHNTQNEEENSSIDESEAPDNAPIEQPKPKRGALIEFDGKSQNICKWGEELGISANTLYGRIYKMGWSVERAFTTPSRKKK